VLDVPLLDEPEAEDPADDEPEDEEEDGEESDELAAFDGVLAEPADPDAFDLSPAARLSVR